MIIIEFDFRLLWPGIFYSRIDGNLFLRVWFGCFAVAYIAMDLKSYGDALRSGRIQWYKTVKDYKGEK